MPRSGAGVHGHRRHNAQHPARGIERRLRTMQSPPSEAANANRFVGSVRMLCAFGGVSITCVAGPRTMRGRRSGLLEIFEPK